MALVAGLAGCQHPGAIATQPAPFATDGCSLFPDRAGASDWRSCCVCHDLAYWRGGGAGERLEADRALRSCVGAAASPALSRLMYAGVRLAGGPYLPTPFRWGFGWPAGRGYQEINAQEEAQLAALHPAWVAPPSTPAPAPLCEPASDQPSLHSGR